MPTLFISYKRGTAAVAPLMERLKAAGYRLWFDRDDIHLGDPSWQARIDQGLERCDGVILNITPAACDSDPIRYEVQKARDFGKPIFPLIVEKIPSIRDGLQKLGLDDKQHVEDFTDVAKWDEQVQRLLRDLEIQGIRVTRHDRRQQRDRHNPAYVLHQTYLKRLVEQIGTLSLAQINPDNRQGIELESVYVDSPTGLGISVEPKDWQVIDWWITQDYGRERNRFRFRDEKQDSPRTRPEALGYERAPLESLLGQVDAMIARYRERYPNYTLEDNVNSWRNDAVRENVIPLHLNHLAAARDRLVILGAPGSGKSTFVKFLALCLAGAGIDDWSRPANLTALENWPHGALTPIYVELRRFVASQHFPADLKTPATADHLWAYIQGELLGDDLRGYADDLRYDLEHGHALLILDGLDEVPYPEGRLKDRQAQLIGLAHSLNTRYASSRMLVSSRPYAYAGWTLPGFSAVTITAFEDDHRITLATRLYRAADLDETTAKQQAQSLNRQLQPVDPELKDRPLFVTLMATIALQRQGEGLPTRRGALYRESILLLLNRWTQSKPNAPSLVDILGDKSVDDLYTRLAALAYDVHNTYGHQPGTPEISYELLIKHLKPLGKHVAVDLVSYLSENAGVLVSPGQNAERDVFHFAHRTFQEYLAAVHLVSLCAQADSFAQVRDHITSKPQVWRVPCVLAGDVLADTDRRGDLWNVLDALLDETVPDILQPDDARLWGVWLASVILEEQGLIGGEKLRRREQAVADPLRDWTLKLIETPLALEQAERAACGVALGLLGDLRKGVGGIRIGSSHVTPLQTGDGNTVIPDMLWLPVETSLDPVTMKTDEQEIGPLVIHPFFLSKYLVTYAQFQTFLDAADGFNDERWWEGMPGQYKKQAIEEQNNKQTNAPRDRVSWYQAVAFGRWMTHRFNGLTLPHEPSGTVLRVGDNAEIRLPLEWEWQWAAQGGAEAREYLWWELKGGHANTSEAGLNRTSAVGMYPHGAAVCGALDMAGNLFEWCQNDRKDPSIIDGYINGNSKVVRGGSFNHSQYYAACAYRDYDLYPSSISYNLGMRFVVAPLIASLSSGTLRGGT